MGVSMMKSIFLSESYFTYLYKISKGEGNDRPSLSPTTQNLIGIAIEISIGFNVTNLLLWHSVTFDVFFF